MHTYAAAQVRLLICSASSARIGLGLAAAPSTESLYSIGVKIDGDIGPAR